MADSLKEIYCPACNTKMTKIFLTEANINIDICLDGCGGIFFDNREFQKCDNSDENINKIIKTIQGREFKAVEPKEVRICPHCNIPMVKIGTGIPDIEIDNCNMCGAKFLDNGELELIRNTEVEDKNERLDIILQALYNKNISDILGNNKEIKTSSRRQFFEKLIFKSITK